MILTGVAGNSCVMHTASDAHMREFKLTVPSDCIASVTPEDNRLVLDHMTRTLNADTRSSDMLRWKEKI